MGEVALAVVLLAGAGLLMRSFANLASVDPGFRPDHLLTMKLSLPQAHYPDAVRRANFTRNVLRRASSLPGVQSASMINILPFRSYFINLPARVQPYEIEGEPGLPATDRPGADSASSAAISSEPWESASRVAATSRCTTTATRATSPSSTRRSPAAPAST
jgi:hypothetical protein